MAEWTQAAAQMASRCTSHEQGQASDHQLRHHGSAAPAPMLFPGGFTVYVVDDARHVQGELACSMHLAPTVSQDWRLDGLLMRMLADSCDCLRPPVSSSSHGA